MPNVPSGELLTAEEAVVLASSLSTWRTVDRRLVHKSALTEVLVTDLRSLSDDVVAVAAQWPRVHPVFQPTLDEDPDPVLFVETLRQAGILLTHELLGVPLGHHFVFESIAARYLRPGPRPRLDRDSVVLLGVGVSPRLRDGHVAGADLRIEAWSGSERFAVARASYRCLPPHVYARLRSLGARDAVPAAIPRPRAAEETTTALAVDLRHPTFFDHPADHLPGMLLIDAALRAGRRAVRDGGEPWDFDLRFERFAELGAPTSITTRPAGSGVEVVVSQPAGVVALGQVSGYATVPAESRSAGPLPAGRS
ncbi:hypothetical protein DQ237_11800 [Blastococcus sp. TF02-8]|uniref:AfsA-related hotdog domain-containing protein n=1 Tax=Blastococcus sp. TF02-8 TaxID=2250574 RepID=UPI000DE9583A|nr:AfsA-related hotdog domain-containing protein [Blastococcus sp. TF02-8]RBY95826.1 hypothetical protein DQ237_11800 [Blastococcus sp. TF02-8]